MALKEPQPCCRASSDENNWELGSTNAQWKRRLAWSWRPVQNPWKPSAEEKQNRTPWEMNGVGLNRPGQRGETGPELRGDKLSTLGKRRACFLESCPQNVTGLGNFKPRGGLRAVTNSDGCQTALPQYRKCSNRVGGRQHASAAGGSFETIPSVSMYTMLTKVPTAGIHRPLPQDNWAVDIVASSSEGSDPDASRMEVALN